MQIRFFANITLKCWHLHSNILVLFNLPLLIVVIIAQVTLEQLYLALTIFVFVSHFLLVVHVTHLFRLFPNLRVFLLQHVILSCDVTFATLPVVLLKFFIFLS